MCWVRSEKPFHFISQSSRRLYISFVFPPRFKFCKWIPNKFSIVVRTLLSFTIYSSVTWYQLSYFFICLSSEQEKNRKTSETFLPWSTRWKRRKTKIYIDWYTNPILPQSGTKNFFKFMARKSRRRGRNFSFSVVFFRAEITSEVYAREEFVRRCCFFCHVMGEASYTCICIRMHS